MRAMTFAVSTSKVLIPRPPSTPTSSQRNLVFSIPSAAIPSRISKLSCFNHRVSKSVEANAAASGLPASTPKRVPARDRVIGFGKYKGKMLGSLPSDYLKWISSKLRAGDTLEWARLADEVLSDPVYRDRIEWEFAENILTGNKVRADSAHINGATALREVSDRFGWDWENLCNGGWSKINFELLGTSYGGRLPRLGEEKDVEVESSSKKVKRVDKVKAVEEDGGGRSERRERLRQRRMKTSSVGGRGLMVKVEDLGRRQEMNDNEEEEEKEDRPMKPAVGRSPFPGREALLKKALNRGRL